MEMRASRLGLVLAVATLVIGSGCATGTEDIRAEMKILREELRAEIQDQRDETASLINALRSENEAERERLSGDIRAEVTESLGRMEKTLDQRSAEWDARIGELSLMTEMTSRNCDLSILEMRKDLFQTKRAAEERNRRINALESTVVPDAETGKKAPRETFVTFIEGNLVSVSAGGDANLREGTTINIYKKADPAKKIASAKITSVDVDSASGEIFYKVDSVTIGDRVEVAEE